MHGKRLAGIYRYTLRTQNKKNFTLMVKIITLFSYIFHSLFYKWLTRSSTSYHEIAELNLSVNYNSKSEMFQLTRRAQLIVQFAKGLLQCCRSLAPRLPFTGNAVFEGTSCHLAIVGTEARVALILERRLRLATESRCTGCNVRLGQGFTLLLLLRFVR